MVVAGWAVGGVALVLLVVGVGGGGGGAAADASPHHQDSISNLRTGCHVVLNKKDQERFKSFINKPFTLQEVASDMGTAKQSTSTR